MNNPDSLSLNNCILSISGWRKAFGSTLSPEDRLLVTAMGLAWARWLHKHLPPSSPRNILVATDTRTTGPAIARAFIAALENQKFTALYPGISAAPETMSRCAEDPTIAAFSYISASHNPPQYNGLKFGTSGEVLNNSQARKLIQQLHSLIAEPGIIPRLIKIYPTGTPSPIPSKTEKAINLHLYKQFLEKTASNTPGNPSPASPATAPLLAILRQAIQNTSQPITIIADMNGSARCLSADRAYLESLHIHLESFNDKPGEIAHQILPEGPALEPCRLAIEASHRNPRNTPAPTIGYVPDNDGDRGNLVIWDDLLPAARTIEAQEVFALSVLAELSAINWQQTAFPPPHTHPIAIVVNGPTSHRIREIAKHYHCEVHETEVGESNIVNRARELRQQGFNVRILGEGSSGGTIVHPAGARDPMNTITALLKLLYLPQHNQAVAPFHDWCRRSGQSHLYTNKFTLAHIIKTLPAYTTTTTTNPLAILQIKSSNQSRLKQNWEKIFQKEWKKHQHALQNEYSFADFAEFNNEGTTSRQGTGAEFRSGDESGGLKIVFRDNKGKDAGFIWMRKSKTEPIFRIMAEIRGNRPDAAQSLLAWQHGITRAAAHHLRTDSPGPEKPIPSPLPGAKPSSFGQQ